MVGTGLCMEGIHQNPIVYELMSELNTRRPASVAAWVHQYALSRYGVLPPPAAAAWELLAGPDGVYGSDVDTSALLVANQMPALRTADVPSRSAGINLYWSAGLNDSYSSLDDCGGCEGLYKYVDWQGKPPASAHSPPSGPTVQLVLYFSGACSGHDNVLITDALYRTVLNSSAAYRRAGPQGFGVWPAPGSGRVAVELFYSPARCDHATLIAEADKTRYIAAGYAKVATVGYIPAPTEPPGPSPPPSLPPLAHPPHNATTMTHAWGLLAASVPAQRAHWKAVGDTTPGLPGPLLYDMVDVARQSLDNTLWDVIRLFEGAYARQDVEAASAICSALLTLLDDLDAVLSTNSNFLLGDWLTAARNASTDAIEVCG